MANHNTTQYANYVSDPRVAVSAKDWGGRVRVLHGSLASTDTAQNDTITVGRLPPGAQVVAVGVKCGDLGTGVTIDIGHAGNVDEWVDGLDVSTAANNVMRMPENFFTTTAETDVIVTLLGANPDASAFEIVLLYVVD